MDLFRDNRQKLNSPLTKGFAITPSDSEDLDFLTRQIRITGNAGNIAVIWADGTESIEPVAAGDIFAWRIARVKATGTTATGIRGYC